MHLDVTMDGSGIDVNVQGVGYTSRQVVNAIDGSTITPGQVGTEADPVKQQHAESISSGEVSVSDSQPVTAGPVGNEGEWMPLGTFDYARDNEYTTTSTTYQKATTYYDRGGFDPSAYSLTNITRYGLSLTGVLSQRDNSTDAVYARLKNWPAVEMTDTSGEQTTGIEPISTSGVVYPHVEIKADGGTGWVFGLTLVLWGQIT